jgi:demethylmacrocin O-methyltransferase
LKVQRVLEIGVAAGASLKMWRDYFVSAQIHGVDLVSIPSVFGDRVTLHVLDQEDEAGLERLGKEFGPFDLVVDDGGHTMKQQQTSFKVLEKYVTKDGLYVVEDLHSSFCGKPYGVEKAEDTTLAVLARLREALIFSSASSGSIVGIVRRGQ